MYTTLKNIRSAYSDTAWREKLLSVLGKTDADEDAISLSTILDEFGVGPTLWLLTHVFGLDGRDKATLFATDCAERAIPVWESVYPEDTRPRAAVEAARAALGSKGPPCRTNAFHAANAAFDASEFKKDRALWAARAAAAAAHSTHVGPFECLEFIVDVLDYATQTADETPDREREWQIDRLRELIEAQ